MTGAGAGGGSSPAEDAGAAPKRAPQDSPHRELRAVIGFLTGAASLAAATLVYMGWAYTDAYLGHFYLRALDLEFGFLEYALRGLTLFTPNLVTVAVLVILLLAALARRSALRSLLPRKARDFETRMVERSGLRRNADRVARVSGVLLTVGGLVLLIWLADRIPGRSHEKTYAVLALLGLGPLVLTWSIRGTPAGRIAFTMALVTASVCLLWAASLHANATGISSANRMIAKLPWSPSVSIYSVDQLALKDDSVNRVDLRHGRYRYRYDGLRLLMIRGGRYYLLPVVSRDDWAKGGGRVIVITDDDEVRVEILPGYRPP
ncbi:hypothetical protein [Streptosporangium sp. NPDC000396]|uniref:hypothetical protein n=1 Tax=Streptosporangium sp. NPDC000396 TaxID=3366185 RepID=UPI0036BA1F30